MDLAAALALVGEGYSRRKIARILRISRNTLKKYFHGGMDPDQTLKAPGKLIGFQPALVEMLRACPDTRAMEVFRLLRAQGYAGSYDLVKRKVRAWRLERAADKGPRGPGVRAAADLGKVDVRGRPLFLFTLVLDFSGRIYAELSERADLEAFLSWHMRAFRYFQGVPAEIAYEKTRNRLLKAYLGGPGPHLPFSRFADHHGFAAVPAEPFAPWAVGRLKRPLRMIETLFLPDYPLQSLEGANTALLGWLLGREDGAAPGSGKDRFAQERAALLPLPGSAFVPVRLKLREPK